MINKIAMGYFDWIWDFFDRQWPKSAGPRFKIFPFQQYFPLEFVNELTEKKAKTRLRRRLLRWGRIHQTESKYGKQEYVTFPDGYKMPIPRVPDLEHERATNFIIGAFYNLCCLARYNVTIEELVFEANKYGFEQTLPREKMLRINAKPLKAFRKLIAISNSFLLAKWVHRIIYDALANHDNQFFNYLSLDLKKDTSLEKYDTARAWLGTILLWYLGGKDIHPRKGFMALLQEKGILTKEMTWESFKAMLSNLGLTQRGK